MKKKKINKAEKMSNIMSFIILFLLGVIIGLIIGRIELKVNNGIELKNLENCSNEVKKYTNIDGSDVYLFCLQDIVINSNKSLKDYNFDGFMDGLKLEETTYDDGGTKVYTNDDIAIIKTKYKYNGEEKTIAIIGPKRMEYDRVVSMLDYIKKNIEN